MDDDSSQNISLKSHRLVAISMSSQVGLDQLGSDPKEGEHQLLGRETLRGRELAVKQYGRKVGDVFR